MIYEPKLQPAGMMFVNERQRIPMGQSKKDNSEKLAT